MKFIFKSFIFALLFIIVFHFLLNHTNHPAIHSAYEEVKNKLENISQHPHIAAPLETLQGGMNAVFEDIGAALNSIQNKQSSPEKIEKTLLQEPQSQSFSVHNIEIGTAKETVDTLAGIAQRAVANEYGVNWFIYHENYQNFFIAAYDHHDQVAGLYTNQDLISSKYGIKLGSSKETVRSILGEPLTGIRKGLITYQTQNNGEYDLFQLDTSFVTIFYDKHENNTVAAIQIISQELEEKRESFYPEGSTALKEGFELLLFDLTNAARVKYGLPYLSWDEQVRETARKHSSDMAQNHFFDHTNLKGQSPFERMEEDQIRFRAAGENLAAGQTSSIFAHEGLMNSLGHRENILHPRFEFLGVGVAFDSEAKPYYTENFLTK